MTRDSSGAGPGRAAPAEDAGTEGAGWRWVPAFLGWSASLFHRIERRGPEAPDGPLLVVANHPNSLLDPLVLYRVLGRPTRALARSGLFEKRVLGFILRRAGALPVYRRQDDPGQTHRNQGTFDAVADALVAGAAVQIYPEGISHSHTGLTEIRTGAARIALQAAAQGEWTAGVRILPVGLTYDRKHFFRGHALAVVGEPIPLAPWRERYEADPRGAARELTDAIREALEALVLSLASPDELELVSVADRMWSREREAVPYRTREPLADRFPRLQGFAQAAAWLRDRDPERYAKLAAGLRSYGRWSRALGTGEGEVPEKYHTSRTIRWFMTRVVPVLLTVPVALVGTLLWSPTFLASRLAVRRLELTPETTATYKFAAGAAIAPFNLLGAAWGLWAWRDWRWAVAAVLLLIPLGVFSAGWHERWARIREDVRLFLRLRRKPGRRDRLTALRRELVAEMAALREEMAAER